MVARNSQSTNKASMSVERQTDLMNSFDTRRRSALTPATVKPLWMMVVTMTITDPKMIWRVKWVLLLMTLGGCQAAVAYAEIR